LGPLERHSIHPDRVTAIQNYDQNHSTSEGHSVSSTESDLDEEEVEDYKNFLKKFKWNKKAIGQTLHLNNRVSKKQVKKDIKTYGTQTQGIQGSELQRRKAAKECHRCAFPPGQKGSHETINCRREIKYKAGTARYKQIEDLGLYPSTNT
jgi:regulatory protein YycI of two-component signal transduction system YycFG